MSEGITSSGAGGRNLEQHIDAVYEYHDGQPTPKQIFGSGALKNKHSFATVRQKSSQSVARNRAMDSAQEYFRDTFPDLSRPGDEHKTTNATMNFVGCINKSNNSIVGGSNQPWFTRSQTTSNNQNLTDTSQHVTPSLFSPRKPNEDFIRYVQNQHVDDHGVSPASTSLRGVGYKQHLYTLPQTRSSDGKKESKPKYVTPLRSGPNKPNEDFIRLVKNPPIDDNGVSRGYTIPGDDTCEDTNGPKIEVKPDNVSSICSVSSADGIRLKKELHRRSEQATNDAIKEEDGLAVMRKFNRGGALWTQYVKECGAGREAYTSHPEVLKEDGEPDVQVYIGFISYINSLADCNDHQVTCAIGYIQKLIDKERTRRRLTSLPGCVRRTEAIKKNLIIRTKEKANRTLAEGVDMQSSLHELVSPQQMMNMMWTIYNVNHPGYCSSQDPLCLTLLGRTQLGAMIRQTFMTGVRGEICRFENYNFCFTRPMMNVGPNPQGETAHMMLSNKGKTNVVGRTIYKAVLPHYNPLLCTQANKGALLVVRHILMDEPYPDHLNPMDLRTRPVYRSMQCHKTRLCDSVMSDHFNNLFNACGIDCEKITHQGRVQFQQDCDIDDCPHPDISRAADYTDQTSKGVNQRQVRSYLTNPPKRTTISAAGGDHRYPKTFYPAWTKPEVGWDLLDLLFPCLRVETERVTDAVNECKGNKAMMKKKNLLEAWGSVSSDQLLLSRFLQFAAALPVDPFKNLLVDGIPYYVQFAGNPLFQLSVFRSEAFHHLVKLVHESQINSHRLKINLPTDTVHVVTQMIESSIKPVIDGLISKTDTLLANQEKLLQLASSSHTGYGVVGNPSYTSQIQIEDEPINTETTGKQNNGPPLFSTENVTLKDFWEEFSKGRNNRTPLRSLEDKGMDWRRDVAGKSRNKKAWCHRVPIYNLVIHYMEVENLDEETALNKTQVFFDTVPKSKNGKAKLCQLGKVFNKELRRIGGYDTRRYRRK